MNDAYTIGLTLALDDGVSAGIETIRRELSALDQAIVASTANLVRLQEVARAAVSAGVAQAGAMAAVTRDSAAAAARQAAVPTRQTMPAESSTDGAAAVPPERPRDQATPAIAPVEGKALPVTPSGDTGPSASPRSQPEPLVPPSPTARLESAGGATDTRSPAVAPASAPVPTPPAAAAAPPAPPLIQAAPVQGTVAPAPAPVRQSTAPTLPPAPVKMMEAAAPMPAPTRAVEVMTVTPATPAVSGKREMDRPTAPAVRIDTAPISTSRMAAPVPTRDVQHRPSMAPAPGGTPMAPAREVPPRRPRHEPASSSAPRQSSDRQREKAVSGTIVIDGVELGRWMADYLAHAASRPPSGGVGFDPRMTPAWAGAPIGA